MARQTVFPQPLLVLAACGLLAAALVAEQPAPRQPPAPADAPFRNAALPIEQRIDGLLAAMTLDEKLACLQTSTAVPRLGVPDMGGSEGLHQLVRKGGFGPEKPVPTTSFALTLGLGATWDPALLQRAGEAQGVEARYITQHPKYHQPVLVNWLNVDLARDPRWGRYEESYGEDPFLTGTLASAYIRGIQGDHPKYWRAAALLKHYLANSNETTRTRSSSDFDARLFREYYSVPFRMAIRDGGARSFMASYNKWNGVPMLLHPTAKTVLAGEWGLDGIFSTDLGAISHLVNHQKYVGDDRRGAGRDDQGRLRPAALAPDDRRRRAARRARSDPRQQARHRGGHRRRVARQVPDVDQARAARSAGRIALRRRSARRLIPSRGPPTRTRRWRATWREPRSCC